MNHLSSYLEPRLLTTKKQTKASQLETRIREDIISGALEPGAQLRLKGLAERYNCGTIPLREALSRLVASGFVLARDQLGFQVVPISVEEIRDITRVRIHIECEALADAIRHGNMDWESGIVETHYRLERLAMTDTDATTLSLVWETAHQAFHRALLSACTSPLLLNYAYTLADQTARYRALSTKYDAGQRDIAAEHRAIKDAALNREINEAPRLLASHYRTTTENLIAHHVSKSKYNAHEHPT